jgi:hypothetical protein
MLALSTGSLYTYGLDRVFGLAQKAGFDGIEVLVDGRWDTRQADYLDNVTLALTGNLWQNSQHGHKSTYHGTCSAMGVTP